MSTDKKPEENIYRSCVKDAGKMETEQGVKANVLHKAYEAAVTELGYTDKQLIDPSKGKKVAKLMFSKKYLGNAEFNPLLRQDLYKGFADKGEAEQQTLYKHMLGMDLHTFVGDSGIASQHGMRRGTITSVIDNHFNNQTAQQLMGLAWQRIYDPEKSFSDNIARYVEVLQNDPLLSYGGTKVDKGKFESIDDAAHALTTSFLGHSTRDNYQNRYGARFNQA